MHTNSLLFCPYCLSWTQIQNGVCRECFRHLELSQPDLSESELFNASGEVISTIGVLVIERTIMPKICRLYQTRHGLLFSPLLTRQQHKYFVSFDRTLACWLAERLIGKAPSEEPQSVNPPAFIYELLFETPGAFYIPMKKVIEANWSARQVVVRIRDRKELVIKPQHRRDGVFKKLEACLEGVLQTQEKAVL